MKVVKPSYEIWEEISEGGVNELKFIERVARVCYKSEGLITDDCSSAKTLIKKLIQLGHEAMLEHRIITVHFTCDRGISHEIVRHRVASFAEQSTRYCNFSHGKFDGEISVIKPLFYSHTNPEISDVTDEELDKMFEIWFDSCKKAEDSYFELLKMGSTPEKARDVLPTSLQTELIMTANYREWRHFFKLRCAKAAHPQMRELTIPLLKDLQSRLPIIFDDIEVAQ